MIKADINISGGSIELSRGIVDRMYQNGVPNLTMKIIIKESGTPGTKYHRPAQEIEVTFDEYTRNEFQRAWDLLT